MHQWKTTNTKRINKTVSSDQHHAHKAANASCVIHESALKRKSNNSARQRDDASLTNCTLTCYCTG